MHAYKKGNVVSFKKHRFSPKCTFIKNQIIKSLFEIKTAILDKLAEQKQERNDQKHAKLPRELNKSLVPYFLQQQQLQQN